MRKILAFIILVGVGLLILAGYAFQESLAPVLGMVMDWGLVLLGATFLVGIGYLLRMHIANLFKAGKKAGMSVILLVAFFFTLIAGLVLPAQNTFYSSLILNIQIPVEASLLAVLAVSLIYASLRLIRTRGWTPLSVGFLVSAVVSLVLESGILPFLPHSPAEQIVSIFYWLPLAGARGILLGMALGGLLVGMRTLLSIERPFDEE